MSGYPVFNNCEADLKLAVSGKENLSCCEKGHLRRTWSSFWISPHGQSLRFCGILAHLPVSIFSLWDDVLSLVTAILANSGALKEPLYSSLKTSSGFKDKYVVLRVALDALIALFALSRDSP